MARTDAIELRGIDPRAADRATARIGDDTGERAATGGQLEVELRRLTRAKLAPLHPRVRDPRRSR